MRYQVYFHPAQLDCEIRNINVQEHGEKGNKLSKEVNCSRNNFKRIGSKFNSFFFSQIGREFTEYRENIQTFRGEEYN